MSGMSITYSGYWYPPSPDNSPHNKTKNLHSEPIHLKWSIQEMLPSNNFMTQVSYPWDMNWRSVWSNGPKGLSLDQRTHKSVQHWEQASNPIPWSNHKRQVIMSVEPRASTCYGEAGRPSLVCVGAKQREPTSRRDQERPSEGGAREAASPGRPA